MLQGTLACFVVVLVVVCYYNIILETDVLTEEEEKEEGEEKVGEEKEEVFVGDIQGHTQHQHQLPSGEDLWNQCRVYTGAIDPILWQKTSAPGPL